MCLLTRLCLLLTKVIFFCSLTYYFLLTVFCVLGWLKSINMLKIHGWLDSIGWKKNGVHLFAKMFSLVAFYRHKEVSLQMLLCERESMPLVGCLTFTIYSVTLLSNRGLRRRMRLWKMRIDSPRCTYHMLAICSMLRRSIWATCTKCLRMNTLMWKSVVKIFLPQVKPPTV